jgi:WD40 repeat protein
VVGTVLSSSLAICAASHAADDAPLLTMTLPAAASSAAFSPDGRTILTTSADGTARLLDAGTGQLLKVVREATASAAFSHDGRRIVAASLDGTARVIETATGRETAVLKGHTGDVLTAAFSQDGARVVTASRDRTARIWDAATGQEMLALAGHKAEVRAAAFNPEGNRVVTVSADKTLRVWTTEGNAVAIVEYPEELLFAAYSPDGTRIVVSTGGLEVRLWNADLRGMPHLTLRGHAAPAAFVAFSPDGGRLVTASEDRSARIWDAGTGRILAVLTGHGAGVRSAAFSADGKRIATASHDRTVRIWAAPGTTGRLPFPAAAAGLWATHVPPDAEQDLVQAVCRTQPAMIHTDGLIVVFDNPDAQHLPVPLQHLRCTPAFDCDIYEGAPKSGISPLGAGKLTLADRAGRFCFQDRCVELARCPPLAWSAQERAAGFETAFERRVGTRGE